MSESASGSPEHSAPGDKTKKYDRQLRLWGDHGQAALEQAKVCLVNATATGTEILKNLILPGIGAFTIVDNTITSGEDVGNNFFLDKESIGKPRAKVTTELLQELNDDVSGDFVEESVENLLRSDPEFFTSFNVVIVTNLMESSLLKLAAHLWTKDIPLFVCRSYGFIGYMRLAVREHTIIESHPDNVIEDLRLDRPFPDLKKYCDSLDLDAMDKKDHSHTPWLVVIYKYLQKWKAEHSGESPKNYREKTQLKEMIRQGMRHSDEGVPGDEENFEEACKNVNTSLLPTTISGEVQKLLDDDKCLSLDSESSPFWILVRALREFVRTQNDGCLPLRGSIPDMTADSERYIQLQNVYKEQANADIAAVTEIVRDTLEAINKPQDSVSDRDIRMFCKHANFLRVLRGRSLEEEYSPSTAKSTDVTRHLDDADEDDVVFYVMLRAVDKFHQEYSRYPGYDLDMMESDIPRLKACLIRLLQENGIAQGVKDEFVHEFCRYGASELHSMAAFLGGVAAQEVIKIVTCQFVPFNNTYVYNAMKQTSVTIEL